SYNTAHTAVATGVSDSLFFQIVYVEPVIHDAITRNIPVDVLLHVFLEFVRQIAQAQIPFLVVPSNNLSTRTFFRVSLDPRGDLIVGCAAGDQRTKITIIDFGKIEPALIKRAIGMIFALPVDEHGAALVHCARRQYITSQRSARAARELFSLPQIGSQ